MINIRNDSSLNIAQNPHSKALDLAREGRKPVLVIRDSKPVENHQDIFGRLSVDLEWYVKVLSGETDQIQ